MTDATSDERFFRTAWWQRLFHEHAHERASYEGARFAVLRSLAFVYLAAFVSLICQLDALLGSHGLLPVSRFLSSLRAQVGAGALWKMPTLFWLGSSDGTMHALAWTGVVLSIAALLGVTNAWLQLALWAIYMSFVHVGQIFYGYGWEIQLCETGFLAVFLCPLRGVRLLPASPTPKIVVWLLRWLVFRVMIGAALIKLRGDECWRDLTCLDSYFETQPNPNPFSSWFHRAPHWAHATGVLLCHFVELVVPWFAFGFRRWRHAAGVILIAFQGVLITSGNLAFLNWLTIVPALACFDDTAWRRLLPRHCRSFLQGKVPSATASVWERRGPQVLGVVVGVLSVAPVVNLASCDQAMNRSFDPLDLVNTYGAFGSVDRTRFEVVLEGTGDAVPNEAAHWQEYELPCMPGRISRRPCFVTPYHYRLDWQMWFVGNAAARGETIDEEPWLVHLVWQLLAGELGPKSLLANDPFPDAPPRWIRAGIWRYEFARRGAPSWWERRRVGEFLPPVSEDDPALQRYVGAFGWSRNEN